MPNYLPIVTDTRAFNQYISKFVLFNAITNCPISRQIIYVQSRLPYIMHSGNGNMKAARWHWFIISIQYK